MATAPNGARWTFSDHAKVRRRQMGLTEHRVLAIVEDAEIDTVTHEHRRATFGDHVVVYEPSNHTIITILHRSHDRYERPEASR